jgi:hypothetical protein
MPTTLNPRMVNPVPLLRVNQANVTSLTGTNTFITDLSSDLVRSVQLSGRNLTVTNITATDNIITNFKVTTYSTDITLSNSFNSNVAHLNTTGATLSVLFPSSLPNGFNVGIFNAGTGIIKLSAAQTLNSQGNTNATPYTGVFVYKANNQFFGVGVLE